ncbi:hypothetical protein KY284_036385 [Solanum tuberosum]|nr:hypothetical protein KY284_036385 [Solanum tuberosum]
MPLDTKRGVDNKVADALSRVSGAELLALVVSPTGIDLFQAIVDSWSSDAELQQLITDLQTDPSTHKQFTWSQGHLRRKGKLVIGKDQNLRTEIMTLWHSGSQEGHSGVEATLKRLLTLFYWKHMRIDINSLLRGVMFAKSMDSIDRLPKSNGYEVILVVVDRPIVKLHGLSETITSDMDVVFLSSFWQGLFIIQGDALTCVACLSKYWYNTSYHSAIQITPYEALYGRPPPLHLPYLPGDSSSAERRMVKRGNKVVAQSGQVVGFPADNATWEFATVLKNRFPLFDP